MADDDGLKLSDWSADKATLIRIDKHIQLCAVCSRNNELGLWFEELLNLRREIIPKMTDEEETKCEDYKVRIRERLKMLKSWGHDPVYAASVKDMLDRYDVFLRKTADAHNMLLRNQVTDDIMDI